MSLISSSQLNSAKRLLFISPLALGDFLYIKTFLAAFKAQQPHIEVDIWLDDNRNNKDAWRLSRSQIMQQWITAEPAFTRCYGCCDSNDSLQAQITQAKALDYDLIITHSGSKSEQFSDIARQISPNGFIVSSIGKSKLMGLFDAYFFRGSDKVFKLDTDRLPANDHITDRYYQLLNSITGLTLDKADFMPSLAIPDEIKMITQNWLKAKFSVPERQGRVVFLNHLSTNSKRDWQQQQLFQLIEKIGQNTPDIRFIINVTGENLNEMEKSVLESSSLSPFQVAVFTVNEHFFELPSIIAQSDVVITVETAIMHFATASQRPLIAMMRQKKPYWAPPINDRTQVLYATQGKGHVSDICVGEVERTYKKMLNSIENTDSVSIK
ncbi:lipopolysaccharide heptosyltransferase family protein [Shewanella canadensis]|uniref:Lipopolysaccharide heptosyltransferase family protein n=1 Tax=Shewanella canadensis TaxID=271096 RepID=A0A3S0L059_9GAMM|nr:glycosyltransferase family 9 protein [Shewanella canadensis]RTR38251.1 lipopolysaccharide heptosyltransferase family protein [Shewanella canadensis]